MDEYSQIESGLKPFELVGRNHQIYFDNCDKFTWHYIIRTAQEESR